MLGSIISLQTTISSWVRSPAHWKIRTQEVMTRLSDITQGSQFPYWLGQQVKTISATNACMCFMALIAAMVTIHYCQCQCVWYLSYSLLLDLRAKESRVLRHVKTPGCGEASWKSARAWERRVFGEWANIKLESASFAADFASFCNWINQDLTNWSLLQLQRCWTKYSMHFDVLRSYSFVFVVRIFFTLFASSLNIRFETPSPGL